MHACLNRSILTIKSLPRCLTPKQALVLLWYFGHGTCGRAQRCSQVGFVLQPWAEAGDKPGNHAVKLSHSTEPSMGIRGLFTTSKRKSVTLGWEKKPEQE